MNSGKVVGNNHRYSNPNPVQQPGRKRKREKAPNPRSLSRYNASGQPRCYTCNQYNHKREDCPQTNTKQPLDHGVGNTNQSPRNDFIMTASIADPTALIPNSKIVWTPEPYNFMPAASENHTSYMSATNHLTVDTDDRTSLTQRLRDEFNIIIEPEPWEINCTLPHTTYNILK